MTVSKRVAKSGAVTLPRQLRQETGILPGVPVDIEADEDGVHIRKHVPTCHFCGTVDDVKTVCGIEICRGCAEKIMEEFKGSVRSACMMPMVISLILSGFRLKARMQILR